jgi:predicted nucleic acid-binding protein
LPPAAKRRARRVVVDTSVLIAGIAGFKGSYRTGRNASADLLYEWIDSGNFLWLVSPGILEEYKEVARRKGIRPHVVGRIINLLKEEAEEIFTGSPRRISPDPDDEEFCLCAEIGNADFLVTLNPADFPTSELQAKIVSPREFLGRLKRP